MPIIFGRTLYKAPNIEAHLRASVALVSILSSEPTYLKSEPDVPECIESTIFSGFMKSITIAFRTAVDTGAY